MNKNEVKERHNDIAIIKSDYLSVSSSVEYFIESIMLTYFDYDGTKNLAHIIFHNDNELSFSKKIRMLERLIQKIFPKILKENPDLIKSLNRIRTLRNNFAHGSDLAEQIDPSIKKNYFRLSYFEEGDIKEKIFAHKDIQLRLEEARNIKKILSNLLDETVRISKTLQKNDT